MKTILFLFLMIYVTSCGAPDITNIPHLPSKQSLANEVRNKALVQLKMERELYPLGIDARMMDQIKVLGLSFHYYKEVNIEQARELLMTAGTVLLNTINSNEQIRPYLENYPFNPENIRIKIFFLTPEGSLPDLNRLIVVSMTEGILTYNTESSRTGPFITICEETFEEAAAKLGTAVSFQDPPQGNDI